MINKTCFPVKLTEIDSLGIAHHANYPLWFEAGRHDYLKNAGLPAYKMRSLGLSLPLLEMECEFKSPAKYKDMILVITKLTNMTCIKVTFEYYILNKLNEKILATGRTVHAWTDKTLEPQNIKKAAPEIYKQLKQLIESTDTP